MEPREVTVSFHIPKVRTACAVLWLLATGVAPLHAAEKEAPAADIPRFRHVDAGLAAMTLKRFPRIRFLVAADFPPFVYRTGRGRLTGYAMGVANALCAEVRVKCDFIEVPWDRLAGALSNGVGDVILAGPRLTPENAEVMDFTRPYLRALGVFAVRREGLIREATGQAMAGRRIGVVKNTVHAAWLRHAFGHSRIHQYGDFRQAAEALRTGRVDALFGDWLQLGFWVRGSASRECCRMLPGWFAARDFTWNDTVMAVKRGNRALRRVLDRYLDILDSEGRLALMAMRFLPVGRREKKK